MKANTIELGVYSIAKLPKGEFIRLTENGPVYIRGDYCQSTKKYELEDTRDMNRLVYRKGMTLVHAGFDY
jgi:hypothetical protein